MQPHIIHSASKSFSPFLKKGYFWQISLFFQHRWLAIITRKYYAKLCRLQYTDHLITVHLQSLYSRPLIMESVVRAPMPTSLRYWKKIYHCFVTTNAKAFRLSSRESTQPKHRLIGQLAGPPINEATPPTRILLQLRSDSLLCVITIHHSQWHTYRGTEGRIVPLASSMWKQVSHLTYISVLAFLWFSVICFVCFSDYFPVIWGFNLAIHIRIRHHFQSFFLSVGEWTPYSGQWVPFIYVYHPGSNL